MKNDAALLIDVTAMDAPAARYDAVRISGNVLDGPRSTSAFHTSKSKKLSSAPIPAMMNRPRKFKTCVQSTIKSDALAESRRERPTPPRRRADVAAMAWRSEFSRRREAPRDLICALFST